MSTIERVQVLSRRLRIAFTVFLILIPTIQVVFWIFFNQLPIPKEMISSDLPVAVQHDLGLRIRLMALAVSFISTSVVMVCVYQLIRLFGLYERAEVFTEGTVRSVRSLGRLLIGLFFARIVENALLSLVLTLDTPGSRAMTWELSSDDCTILIIGIVTVLVAWIMEEGRRVHEEQRLTI
jgi:hypothetical protein